MGREPYGEGPVGVLRRAWARVAAAQAYIKLVARKLAYTNT